MDTESVTQREGVRKEIVNAQSDIVLAPGEILYNKGHSELLVKSAEYLLTDGSVTLIQVKDEDGYLLKINLEQIAASEALDRPGAISALLQANREQLKNLAGEASIRKGFLIDLPNDPQREDDLRIYNQQRERFLTGLQTATNFNESLLQRGGANLYGRDISDIQAMVRFKEILPEIES